MLEIIFGFSSESLDLLIKNYDNNKNNYYFNKGLRMNKKFIGIAMVLSLICAKDDANTGINLEDPTMLDEKMAEPNPTSRNGVLFGFDLRSNFSKNSPKLNGNLILGYQHYFGGIFGIKTSIYGGSNLPYSQDVKISNAKGSAIAQSKYLPIQTGISLDLLFDAYQTGNHAFGLSVGAGYRYSKFYAQGSPKIKNGSGSGVYRYPRDDSYMDTVRETRTVDVKCSLGQEKFEKQLGDLLKNVAKDYGVGKVYTRCYVQYQDGPKMGTHNKEFFEQLKKNSNGTLPNPDRYYWDEFEENQTEENVPFDIPVRVEKITQAHEEILIDDLSYEDHAATLSVGMYYSFKSHQFGLNYTSGWSLQKRARHSKILKRKDRTTEEIDFTPQSKINEIALSYTYLF